MPAEEAEDGAAEEHVVEVRDDEVGVLCCVSIGGEACMTPDSPPMVNIAMKPMANMHGRVEPDRPPTMVKIQLKIFTPVGMAISIVAAAKTRVGHGAEPVVNMWCAHTVKPRKPMAHARRRPSSCSRRAACATRWAGSRRPCPSAGRIRM